MKLKIKLNLYIFSFFILIAAGMLAGDIIKYLNYRNILIQNFINKNVYATQEIREDFRLLFDKLQYDFRKSEPENIQKINQLHRIYQRDKGNFDVDKAAVELNEKISFGTYQVFLINKDHIIENASYKKDIGFDFGQIKSIRELIETMFQKQAELDVSPIYLDSGSMRFKRYLLKLSDDGRYLLQVGFVLDITKKIKAQLHSMRSRGQLEMYLANDNTIAHIELENSALEKVSVEDGWRWNRRFFSKLVKDLAIKTDISSLIETDVSDKSVRINSYLSTLFPNDGLRYRLDLDSQRFIAYSITDGLFNIGNETKLLIKITYPTKSLEEDLQLTLNQTVLQFFILVVVLALIYLFIRLWISSPLLRIIDTIKRNQYSNMDHLHVSEIAILNDSYNALHSQLNREIKLNVTLLEENKKFIANTVHQIRTPLTNIMMNGEMIKKFQKDDSLSSFVDKIDSSIHMLSDSYENLAYLTTYDSIEYNPVRLSLSDAINQKIKFFETISKVNRTRIISSIHKDINIFMNQTELERITDNNIANSIKYGTKDRPIFINLSKSKDAATVSFSTYGDPIKNKDMVFEKHYRENEAKRGLGIGLNMVKDICERNGVTYDLKYQDNQNIFSYTFKTI